MIEIVITGRHDDYGGRDFMERLCAAAAHNHRLLDACGVEHRFTLAEWNPIEGRPLLADLVRDRLPWWHHYLVVDRRWHERLSTNPRLQFMEFFAKNAAVRRSAADAILTTNSDVFLSTEVARALATRKLDDRVVYRAVRIDIDRTVNWQNGGEAALADPKRHLRVNDLQPPDYGNSAGDFLLMTRGGWMAIGGFNERVRYAKIHKDGQFCINANLEGYAFESLGPIYHIDHDGSYSNAEAAGVRGSADAPYGPEWDYRTRYRNPESWGLSAGIDEPASGGMVHVHHPSTHGPLLSVIAVADPSDAAAVNAQLATATGQFVVVTQDPSLAAFGGRAALEDALRTTDAGLIAPSGTLGEHPVLGQLPYPGTPYVIRRDLVDMFTEWPHGEADPGLAFWLRAMEHTEIAQAGPRAERMEGGAPRITATVQTEALIRRGRPLAAPLLQAAIQEQRTAARGLRMLVERWVASVVPETDAACAIVGPDWATPILLEVLAASGRTLAGVFTPLVNEEGSTRWGQRLRPLADLSASFATHVLAGSDGRIGERLAAIGCTAAFHLIGSAEDVDTGDAELDALRRAQARDLERPKNINAVLERLPVFAVLEGERSWAHRYDAALACDRVKRSAAALELFQEVLANSPDMSLAMRAAFHAARLLIARGALHQAAPLLAKILKHNPDHRAAREMLEEIMPRQVVA